MILFQIIAFIFGLILIVSTLYLIIKERISPIEGVLFLGLWGLLIIFVIFPAFSTLLANLFGIGRGVDLILYFLLGLGLIIQLYIIVKVERLETDLTTVVREIAIMKAEEKHKIKKKKK